MSYETVIEQVKTLPEECLDDVSKYMSFLLYRYGQNEINRLSESDEEFNEKMQKGYDDMVQGRVKPLEEAFSDVKKRFA